MSDNELYVVLCHFIFVCFLYHFRTQLNSPFSSVLFLKIVVTVIIAYTECSCAFATRGAVKLCATINVGTTTRGSMFDYILFHHFVKHEDRHRGTRAIAA